MDTKNCKKVYERARNYLLSFDGVDNEIIDKHLDHWKQNNPKSLKTLLFAMLDSVQNRLGMPNAIGKLENLRTCFCDFDPTKIIREYKNDWRKLFRRVSKEYNPPGRMDIDNPRSYWVIFCKSTLSASNFLSTFANFKKFNAFVETFDFNEYTRVALPLLLEKEVFGLGFALACDFLKENGYPKFIKPDVHIMKIFNGIGFSNSELDYEVFKDVIRFAEAIDEIPYRVDKLFWLVGSGRFYLDEKRISTDRDDFIRKVRSEL